MRVRNYCRQYLLGLQAVVVLCWLPVGVHAEITASVYLGKSSSQASDVHLGQPNNTSLTFHDVAWDDKSFENPLYWGLRLTYWLPRAQNWGIALDLTHAKIHANLNANVQVSGVRAGAAVDTVEPLRSTFDELAMSHGFNQLTLNAMHRWRGLHGRWARVTPYVGIGAGLAYPHVEVATGGSQTSEYQLAGWVANGLAGISYKVGNNFEVFLEYKLSYTDVRASLAGGGGLDTAVWTQHFNLGASYHFGQSP